MKLKPITAMAVLLFVVASLLVAGCTTSTTSNSNQTPSVTPTPIASKETVSGNNTTFSSDNGYSITFPNTWPKDVNNSTDASVELQITMNSNETALIGVSVYGQKLESGDTLQKVVEDNLKEISTTQKNYTLLSSENTTLAGEPASKAVFQLTQQNVSVKNMQIYSIHNDTLYLITYKVLLRDYDTYLEQAQEIINSFKFTS